VRDFIGRVAARAVGERAAASPRVPSLFEAPGPAPGGALEVIDEEVVAPAPTRATLGARAAPRRSGDAPVPSAAPAPLPGESGAMRVEADPLPPAERGVEAPPRESGERMPEPVATTRAPAPPGTQHEERAPAAVAVAAPVLTPALPVVPRAPARAVPMPAAAPAEPPAVRVHIGRLEVRANLQEQPRRPERSPAPRPQELSLSDYLRGQRGSR
jgi:hypothetical protein